MRATTTRISIGLCVLALLAGGWWLTELLGGGAAELSEAFEQRGRVVALGSASFMARKTVGTRLEPLERFPTIAAAVRGGDGVALAQAMRAASVDGLAVDAAPGSSKPARDLLSRLARYEHVEGMRGLFVSPHVAIYTHDIASELLDAHRTALLGVARGLLEGARPPRISSFPEPLSRMRHVEVMLLLRHGGQARLWRSARGSSLARALVTAATVARERWMERAQAMGGPLDQQLASLTIEVALLQDDGTLGRRDAAFLQLAFKREHGAGFEYKGAWRYLLPELMSRHATPLDAYHSLLEENGHPLELLGAAEVRLYRLSVTSLASGPGRLPGPDDGVLDVKHPDDVLPR